MKAVVPLALLLLAASVPCANAEEPRLCRIVIPASAGSGTLNPGQIASRCKPGDQLAVVNFRSDIPETIIFDAAAQNCDAQKPIVFSGNRASFVCTVPQAPSR